MDTDGVIRIILLVDIVSMGLLSLFYLSQRRLSWPAFCAWSLLAVLIPVFGPFLVIASRPGSWNTEIAFGRALRQSGRLITGKLSGQLQRLRIGLSDGEKLTRIERARQRRALKNGSGERK